MPSTEEQKWAELDAQFSKLYAQRSSGVLMRWPQLITDFLVSYLENHPPRTVLDVTADVDGLLPALVQHFHPDRAVGLKNESRSGLIYSEGLSNFSNVEWITGNPVEALEKQEGTFDLVIGMPPWIRPPSRVTLPSQRGLVTVNDDAGSLLMLRALLVLGAEGVGFFVMPPSFLSRRKADSVRSHLLDFGIYIHEALAIPARTFAPSTSIGGVLIVARRRTADRLFIGELSSDNSWQKVLEKNIAHRKP